MPNLPDRIMKGSHAVMARADGPEFLAIDRKVFNVLLANAYRAIQSRGSGVHRIKLSELADGLLMGYETAAQMADFNRQIHESLKRLWSVNVEIDFEEEGKPYSVKCHYLSYSYSKVEGSDIVYAFDDLMLACLYQPSVYALIELNVSSRLKSGYAGKLYETMKLYHRRFDNTWEAGVEALRSHLELGDKYPRFEQLREHVIERAVAEVNDHAEFSLTVKYHRSGRGGKVDRVSFTTVPKQTADIKLIGASKPATPTGRDRDTVDMFDGITEADRSAPPPLSSSTVAEAARMLGVTNDDVLYERDKWFEEFGVKTHRRPDESFLAWLHMRESKATNPELKDVDTDALFNRLLDDF